MDPGLSPDMTIARIVTLYPETEAVFRAHGFEAVLSPEGMRALAPFLTLRTALRSRLIGLEGFMGLLREALASAPMVDAPGLEDLAKQGDLSLLALMPCGLKMSFSRAITGLVSDLQRDHGLEITYAVEGNLNQELSYYPYVDTIETVGELPDIIVSSDFNVFHGQRFHDRFVANGIMVGYGDQPVNERFQQAGIVDMDHGYSVLAVNPLVMVANLSQVGGRCLPTCWDDLLDPQWRNSVVLRGGNGFYCHAVLLPVYQRHGSDGLIRLAANVRQGLHPSQMVKQIDAGGPGAIYVMPEFFAHRIKNQATIQILWPRDGALSSPVTLQVKQQRISALRPVLEYLTGPELAKVLVGARFPVPRTDVHGEVQDRPLQWLGWEYLRAGDLLARNREIDAVFLPRVAGS